MPDHDIRPVSAAEVRPIREAVLRPGQPAEKLVYAGDDHPLALHAGAFHEGRLVGIASFAPDPFPLGERPGAWRLRGMATLPEARRLGYGAALIMAGLAHIAANGGAILWCNGRTSAWPFYQSLGFACAGEEFATESGPHYVMWRAVEGELLR